MFKFWDGTLAFQNKDLSVLFPVLYVYFENDLYYIFQGQNWKKAWHSWILDFTKGIFNRTDVVHCNCLQDYSPWGGVEGEMRTCDRKLQADESCQHRFAVLINGFYTCTQLFILFLFFWGRIVLCHVLDILFFVKSQHS